jgi:hypothetical protein
LIKCLDSPKNLQIAGFYCHFIVEKASGRGRNLSSGFQAIHEAGT